MQQQPTAEAPSTEEPTAPSEPTQEESPTEAPASVDGEALLQDRCARCHGLDRTTGASKSREGWATTVDRMIDKGVVLSAEERDVLISYLAEMYGE
jgi:mono/diheme cytochrome c family protein